MSQGKYKEEQKPEDDHRFDEVKNGPITPQNRQCRDIFCCLLILVNIAAMVALALYSYIYGNTTNIYRATDEDGDICGKVGSVTQNYPYAYFYNPTTGDLSKRTCVMNCPYYQSNGTLTSLSCYTTATIPSCSYTVTIYQNGSYSQTPTTSDFIGYDSIGEIERVCVPSLVPLQNAFSSVSTTISSGLRQAGLANFITDLQNNWRWLLLSLVLAVVISFIFMFMLRCLAGCFIWLSLFSMLLVTAALGILFLYNGGAISKSSYIGNLGITIPTLPSNSYYNIFGYISFGFTGLFLLIILCCCSRIRLAVAVCNVSGQFVARVCQVMLVPIIIGAFIFGLWISSVLAMIGLIGGADFQVNGSDVFTSIASYTNNKLAMFYYYVFGTLWVNALLQAIAIFVIASAACMWYYSHAAGSTLDSPVSKSFWMAIRFHFGSLAFGSLIIALIQLLQFIVELFSKQAEQSGATQNKYTAQTFDCGTAGVTQVVGTTFISSWISVSQSSVGEVNVFLSGIKSSVLISVASSTSINSQTGSGSVSTGIYNWYGLETITVGVVLVETVTISIDRLNCVGSACPSGCVTTPTCNANNGNVYHGYCFICQTNSVWVNTKCVCNSQSILIGSTCQLCGSNSSPNSAQTACVCNQGYYLSGSSCIATPNCPPNSVFNISTGVCVCSFQYQYLSNGVCVCPAHQILNSYNACVCDTSSYYSDYAENVCTPCWANSLPIYGCLTCQCKPGYIQSGQSCVQVPTCPYGAIPVLGNAKTPSTCQCLYPGQSYVNGACVCTGSNTVFYQGACLSCGTATANVSSQTCQCPTGKVFVNSGCVGSTPPTCSLSYSGGVCTPYRLLQGIKFNNLPSYFINNSSACNNLLVVNCQTPSVAPTVTLNYLPSLSGCFLLQVDVVSIITVPVKISCSINPIYSSYFSTGDLAQVWSVTVNPSNYPQVSECTGCGSTTTNSTTTTMTSSTTTSSSSTIYGTSSTGSINLSPSLTINKPSSSSSTGYSSSTGVNQTPIQINQSWLNTCFPKKN